MTQDRHTGTLIVLTCPTTDKQGSDKQQLAKHFFV